MAKLSDTTKHILEAFVPYEEENALLSFNPSVFFNHLEKKTGQKKRSLQTAYYRSIKNGLIELDDKRIPRLTSMGRKKICLYKPMRLKLGAHLIVIFDIPERERYKRQQLRTLLKELSFRQIQKSVWETKYDYKEYLRTEIAKLNLQEHVRIYEAAAVEL